VVDRRDLRDGNIDVRKRRRGQHRKRNFAASAEYRTACAVRHR
jgi:hypothetical protein